jgi:FMN reductase
VLHGVYAEDKQIHHYDRQPELDPVLATRLEEAVHTFWLALSRRHQPVALAV